MRPFAFQRALSVDEAVRAQGAFLAGGTSLVDLMKIEVLNPDRVVDITRLPLKEIKAEGDGIRIGALATNTDVAESPLVKERAPVLSEALLSGASPQLRNAATVGGNLLQRTRCAYYRDLAARCNKREPGSGCDAQAGWTRMHAIVGGSEQCIALHPSDMCVALLALDAVVKTNERELPVSQLHLLPADHPEREFALHPGELIVSVFVPAAPKSRYVKVRDRQAFAFALASCAAISDGRRFRFALGGVGTKPWRVREAEELLDNQPPSRELFAKAAARALEGAKTTRDNAFKVELAKRTAVRALSLAAGLT